MTLARLALVAPLLAAAAPAEAAPWVQADRDGDGAVTFEEARSVFDDLAEVQFAKADRDGDGLLDRREFVVLSSIHTTLGFDD